MLEYIVRPFQQPNAHGTIIISSNPKETEERAIITWGGEATLPDTQFITTGFQIATCKEDSIELRRDSSTTRIYGNDPENWIDVNRADKLYLDKQEENWKKDPASAGQTDYADAGDFRPSEFKAQALNDVQKCAVTMKLNNNTTGTA
jgi:hypothetical protein